MGNGKDGSIGFKVLDKKDLDVIFFIVDNFGNNVFKVGNFLGSERLVVFFFLVVIVINCCDGIRGYICVCSYFLMFVV